MIEIKTEELVKPLSNDSNLTPVYNRLYVAVDYLFFVSEHEDPFIRRIHDGKKDAVKDFFAQYDKDYKIIKLAKIDPELVQEYEEYRKGFEEYEKNIQEILNCVKIGESQEVAVKKLAKLTKTARYFSLITMKYRGYHFNFMSEEDILKELNHSENIYLVGIGTPTLNVRFKNGKVKEIFYY